MTPSTAWHYHSYSSIHTSNPSHLYIDQRPRRDREAEHRWGRGGRAEGGKTREESEPWGRKFRSASVHHSVMAAKKKLVFFTSINSYKTGYKKQKKKK